MTTLTLEKNQSLSPPLKWAGGKRWLVPMLKEVWVKYPGYRLVEPFVGGMAVALGLQPDRALLNDINPHLINFYEWLQMGLMIDLPMVNDQFAYNYTRVQFNNLIAIGGSNTLLGAQLFYYLNRTGYNGLCRFNNDGFYNVPFGKYKTINYQTDFTAYKSALSNFDLRCGDFSQLEITLNDFIYADPPYDTPFSKYSATDFKWSDQVRLVKWLAAQTHCPVIASNQATDRIIELYQDLGFTLKFIDAPRRISCKGDRTTAREMLAYRNFEWN